MTENYYSVINNPKKNAATILNLQYSYNYPQEISYGDIFKSLSSQQCVLKMSWKANIKISHLQMKNIPEYFLIKNFNYITYETMYFQPTF